MKLIEKLKELESGRWIDGAGALANKCKEFPADAKSGKAIFEQFCSAVENNDEHLATNYLLAGLIFSEDNFIERVKKKGVLRVSRYAYQHEFLLRILSALLGIQFAFAAKTIEYLKTMENLWRLAAAIRAEYEQIRDWLSEDPESRIKSTIAWTDYQFMKVVDGQFVSNRLHVESDQVTHYEAEELACGLSAILALYHEEFGPIRSNTTIVSLKKFYKELERTMISAAKLAMVREWEVQIDAFQYTLIQSGLKFELSPPSMELMRAIELGYIRTGMQKRHHFQNTKPAEQHSLREMGQRIALVLKANGRITTPTHPVKRVRLDLPVELFSGIARVGELFEEESRELSWAAKELLTEISSVLEFRLTHGLQVRDLFLGSRVFQLIREILSNAAAPLFESDTQAAVESLGSVFERSTLIGLFNEFLHDQRKAELVVDFLTADLGGYVDIQYRPLIPVGKSLLLPPNIFATSNVLRNPFLVSKQRLFANGQEDPLSESIAEAIRSKGHGAFVGLNYSDGEADVVAVVDDTAFVFECKNSIGPTGFHELRTSYDYVKTAAMQLTRFQERWKVPKFRETLEKETGLRFSSCRQLVTGIILSNRMFLGYRINGHPVRSGFETCAFIDRGEQFINEEATSFWKGTEFSGQDLSDYLTTDHWFENCWNAMVVTELEYRFDNVEVVTQQASLDLLEYVRNHGSAEMQELVLRQAEQEEQTLESYSTFRFVEPPRESKPSERDIARDRRKQERQRKRRNRSR